MLAVVLFTAAVVDLSLTELLLPEGGDWANLSELALHALIVSAVYSATTVSNIAILVSAWRATPANIAPGEQLG